MKHLRRFCFENNIKIERLFYLIRRGKWSLGVDSEDCYRIVKNMLKGLGNASLFFNYAFDWDETDEGYYYWRRVEYKWHTYCRNHKIYSLR